MTAIAASYAGYFTVDYGVGVVEAKFVAVVDAALVEVAPVAGLARATRNCWRECISMNHVWATMRARRKAGGIYDDWGARLGTRLICGELLIELPNCAALFANARPQLFFSSRGLDQK
jgi:hypothetical protein